MLQDGLHDLPAGRIAMVVTHLELTARPAPRAGVNAPGDVALTQECPTPDAYRALFRMVGQNWLWFSRLEMDDQALSEVINDPQVEICVLRRGDREIGLLELDFRAAPAAELAFFGLAPTETGAGLGGWLMEQALDRAFIRQIERLVVHTCTLDSPAALPFYRRSGFVPVRQQIEIAPDPRLNGPLPRDTATQIPIFEA